MMGPWPLPFFHPFAPGWRHMSSVFRVSSEDVTMTGTCSKNRGWVRREDGYMLCRG